jgi:hypothetical protein
MGWYEKVTREGEAVIAEAKALIDGHIRSKDASH